MLFLVKSLEDSNICSTIHTKELASCFGPNGRVSRLRFDKSKLAEGGSLVQRRHNLFQWIAMIRARVNHYVNRT